MISLRNCTTLALALALASNLSGCANLLEKWRESTPAPATTPKPAQAMAGVSQALIERRDTIVATGYAVIGVQNHKSAPQQRLLAIRAAKIDAYRGLAEQIYGLHLDANTTVAEMTIMSDSFRTRVEGVVYGANLTSISPINNDTYEVTLSLDSNAVNDLRLLYLSMAGNKRR